MDVPLGRTQQESGSARLGYEIALNYLISRGEATPEERKSGLRGVSTSIEISDLVRAHGSRAIRLDDSSIKLDANPAAELAFWRNHPSQLIFG